MPYDSCYRCDYVPWLGSDSEGSKLWRFWSALAMYKVSSDRANYSLYAHHCAQLSHIAQYRKTSTTLLHPFNSPLSETTRVSRYQKDKTRKVKPIWIYWSKRQWVAVASAGPYANLHLAPDTASHHSIFFTSQMPFLPPNQQHQSTEGIQTSLLKWLLERGWIHTHSDAIF